VGPAAGKASHPATASAASSNIVDRITAVSLDLLICLRIFSFRRSQ